LAAHNPINPKKALEIVGSIADDDALAEALAEYAAGGVVKTYARVVEKQAPWVERGTVRDARMDRDLWRQIIVEGKLDDVWKKGSVRLVGDATPLGRPATSIVGISFDEKSVTRLAERHGGEAPTPSPITCPDSAAAALDNSGTVAAAEPQERDAAPAAKPARKHRPANDTGDLFSGEAAQGPDPVNVSVDDAARMLGVGRTTVYKLMEDGKLDKIKIGGRTLISVESIRRLGGER